MRGHDHPSDHDLVLAMDGELSSRSRAAVDAHVAACAECSARLLRLEQAGAMATSLSRSPVPSVQPIDQSRDTLRAALADAARRREASLAGRLAPAVSRLPRWAMLGAAAAAAMLVVGLAQVGMRAPVSAPLFERDALPIASLTPGATVNVTVGEICAPADHERRLVPAEVRAEVLRAYGMERVPADQYELDYLITPELGGAPAARNLWPQRYGSRTWNAHVKDELEDLLPKLVCEGRIPLQTAQRDIAADWIAAYRKYFHTDRPLRSDARSAVGLMALSAER